jgi:DNA-binding MarR family transcriptional regulator
MQSSDIATLAGIDWARFGSLADPTRRAIFYRLLERPMEVKVIAAEMPISQPAVSQHLKILKQANLIFNQRRGRCSLYVANPLALDWLSVHFGHIRDHALDMAKELQPQGLESTATDVIDAAMSQWEQVWPEHDSLSVGVIVRLRLIARTLEQLSERSAARFQLSNVQVLLLATLDRLKPNEETTLTELSKISFMSLPATARHLDRTQKRGLISRRRDTSDARSNLICLTQKGRDVLHTVLQSQREHEHSAVYQMTAEERMRLDAVLRTLLSTLHQTLGERDETAQE